MTGEVDALEQVTRQSTTWNSTRREAMTTMTRRGDDETRGTTTEWRCDDERQDGTRQCNNQTNKADVARCMRGHDVTTRLDKTRWGKMRQGEDWENTHSISLIYFRIVFSQVS
jgi:hypothetical protein